MSRRLFLPFLVLVITGCQLPEQRAPLRPLPAPISTFKSLAPTLAKSVPGRP